MVLLGKCAVARAMATSAGPLTVVSERHPGLESGKSVLVRGIQSMAVTPCESRTHK